jgi:hypothetical protein
MRFRGAHFAVLLLLFSGSISPIDQANGASQSKIKLVVRVDLETGKKFRWALNCRPNSGTHPAITSTCDFLTSNAGKKVFNLRPASTSCLQIFGGDSKANITGTFYGKRISVDLDRRDGCRIAQWESLIRVVRFR